jgi:dephospho-CoA kinase
LRWCGALKSIVGIGRLATAEERPLRVVGLTGGIGAGKSAAADCFAARGVRLVDTDQISHRLTGKGGAAIPAIVREFGSQAVDKQGVMDRAVMRKMVFSDPGARKTLEGILHPQIVAETRAEIAQVRDDPEYHQPYVLVAVPLLFERMSFRQLLWRTLVIDCSVATQIARAASRPGLSAAAVGQVIQAQIPRNVRLQLGHDVIWNGGDLVELDKNVDTYHRLYCRLAAN